MNGLKARIRAHLSWARDMRLSGHPIEAARYLEVAGEYRRSLFYVYGNRS